MIEVKNAELELSRLRVRLLVAMFGVITLFGILSARFVYLQVYKYTEFTAQAEDNRISVVPVAPSRGLIYDRNGVLLAENISEYTLEVNPNRVANLERTIQELSEIVEITPRDRRRFKKFLEESKTIGYLPLKTRLTDDDVAKLAAFKFRYPGVEVRARLFRKYPQGDVASHVLGYIGRISPEEEAALSESDQDSNYAGTTHIGKIGIEQSYEKILHGKTGAEEVEVSAAGRAVRSLSTNQPVPGSNLVLSIDVKLQKLVEDLYGERKGALVAIEPATGDVLAFVSKPTYDPNLFTDGIDPQTWQGLNESPDKPMLNRPLRGAYPPGSTYKPFMAMAALETGARVPTDGINDPGYFAFGGRRFRDSRPGGNGYVDLHKSIVVSSDTYYYILARDMGVDKIHDFMKPWNFGQLTGIDMRGEERGVLPSMEWKQKRYKQKWHPGETISIGIGQGYNNFTILQLAHATATLANRGKVMKPHLVKAIEDPTTKKRTFTVQAESYTIALKEAHMDFVRNAMIDVSRFGTSRIAFANSGYVVAGKTGTAQVIAIKQNERYDAKKVAERFRDHSLFMAYAPADNPKMALAIIVENGGFGAQAAAPIARKAFDYFLLGKMPDELSSKEPIPLATEDEMRDLPENAEGEPEAPATGPATPAPGQVPATPNPAAIAPATPAPRIENGVEKAPNKSGEGKR
jgi:penicillin-binding protein 2